MINIENRKAEVAKNLQEEYSEKQVKWWQQKKPVYRRTGEVARESHYYPVPLEELTIKYDLKGALTSSALFLCIYGWFVLRPYFTNDDGSVSNLFFGFVCILFLLVPVFKRFNRTPLFVLGKEGILLCKNDELVPWHYLVEAYIKEDQTGDSSSHYLLLHYYEEMTDYFHSSEFDLDGLDKNREEIAVYIEYFRKSATSLQTTLAEASLA